MVLEATVICVDNSEWMRNGDYAPTRFQAQADAVNLICGAKTQSNPENTVGVLTMAGKGVRVLVTPTADLGKILSSLHGLDVGGEPNIASGVQVAQLALKHRQNKNQRQRIVLFAGSPVHVDEASLVAIGKKLKKNNVAVDIVSFGDEDPAKSSKLQALLSAVNSNDNSHLVHVPPEATALSDVLLSSPIFMGDGEGGSGFAAAAAAGAALAGSNPGGSHYDFGIDPNMDPELALAIRASLEEENARLEAAAQRAGQASLAAEDMDTTTEGAPTVTPGETVPPETGDRGVVEGENLPEQMVDDDLLLQQALNLSLAEASSDLPVVDVDMGEDEEDDELALALQMSLNPEASTEPSEVSAADVNALLANSSIISSILEGLPGVNASEEALQRALAEYGEAAKRGPFDDDEDEDEDDDNMTS